MTKTRFLVAISYWRHTKPGREGDEFSETTQSAIVGARDEEHAITILRDRFNLEREALTAATAVKTREGTT